MTECSLIYTILDLLFRLEVVGLCSVRQQCSLLKGPSGQTEEQANAGCAYWGELKRMEDGNEGANCFQWILKSNSSPRCMDLAARKWNIDDYGENKGKWLRYMIDLKATDLCRTCLNRQYVSPGFYRSVYTCPRFNIAEVGKYHIILIYILYYS